VAIGKLAGWAAAGDVRARAEIDAAPGELGEFARTLIAAIAENPPCPAVALLR